MAEDALVDTLREALGADAVITERSELEPYEKGWRYGKGRARAVVRPRTPAEVAQVLALAHERGVRVHPIGANTGLVGASNPDASGEQLVVSFERLSRTIEVDPIDRTVLVDAGVLLSQLNEALEPHGLFFPIDLSADPQVGGLIATNAGGGRLLRYGDVRANLLGIEVALSDGTLVSRLRRLRKDNTGLDLKQLFTGTSGAFGLITRAVLRLARLPRQRASALVAVSSGEAALALLAQLESTADEVLSAFETVSGAALEHTLRHGANLRNPFPEGVPAYAILVELSSSMPRERLDLETLLEECLGEHMQSEAGEEIADVLLGRSEDFWNIRHQISESLRHAGHILALDLCVPRARLAAFTRAATQLVASTHPFVSVCDYGHWGDGGTHFNLVWDPAEDPAGVEETSRVLQERIYELCVREFDGSYSAEHGIGPHNRAHYERYTPAVVERVRQALRRELDPDGLLERRGAAELRSP